MLARLLRTLLLIELMLYFAAGYALVHCAGWSAAQTVVALLLAALAGRAAFIAATFALSRAWARGARAMPALGVAAALRMFLQEYAAFLLVFSVIQPFERAFMGRDAQPVPRPGKLPLLLLHGYECNRGFWWWIRRRLARAGWTVATLNLEPVFAGIEHYADQVGHAVQALAAAARSDQVILVAHSMGGLVARAYLQRYGVSRVARLVTLGSPHHGSRLARLGFGLNARQMEPGSEWLAELEHVALPASCVSIYSRHDNYVMPADSSRLQGARNIALDGIGHLAMAFDRRAYACLVGALDQR